MKEGTAFCWGWGWGWGWENVCWTCWFCWGETFDVWVVGASKNERFASGLEVGWVCWFTGWGSKITSCFLVSILVFGCSTI